MVFDGGYSKKSVTMSRDGGFPAPQGWTLIRIRFQRDRRALVDLMMYNGKSYIKDVTYSISRLKTLHPRSLLVAQHNIILSRSRLGLLRFFHLPIRFNSPLLASSRCPTRVCPYIHAVHIRLVQMQPEVGLAGPGAPVLGAREVLAVPCAPTGAVQVSVVPRRRRCRSFSGKLVERSG